MAEIRLGIRTDSLRGLSRRIDHLMERLANPGPAMDEAAEYMVRSSKYRLYQSKTDPDGTPWAPLSEETIRTREQQGYDPDNILVMSGDLARSVRVEEADDDGFTVTADPGDDDSYAGYHQYGTRRMPRRQILGFTDANLKRIARILQNHVLNQETEGGFDE